MWASVIGGAVQLGTSLFGGGGNDGPCPGQPSDTAIRNALAAAPQQRIAQLNARWLASNPSEPLPVTDPARLGKLAWGGSDCRAFSAAGQALKADVQDLVATYGSAASAGVNLGSGWTGGATIGGTPGGGWGVSIGAQQTASGPLGLPWWAWALVAVGVVVIVSGRGGLLRLSR